MGLTTFFRYLTGPRLYRLYKIGNQEGWVYVPNQLESCGDNIVKAISVAWSFSIYTTPILIPYLYKHDYFSWEGILNLMKLATTISAIILGSYFIRGVGRSLNPKYVTFLHVLEESFTKFPKEKASLARYDFQFHAWPAEYNFSTAGIPERLPMSLEKPNKRKSMLESFKLLPCKILGYLAVHTIGKRMVYPGSVQLLQMLMSNMLLEGRARLVQKFHGQRFKLITKEGNELDSMFVDRRRSLDNPDGKYLVVCCEGNAGFYEYGTMFTPLDLGYSVLGWNHPGFAGSTGTPFPDEEQSAIDTVMQFAIKQLKFPVENIVVFAWSIGGYTASYAAMIYPRIKGVVLDATFDDILPLALGRMPPSWKPLVVQTIRDYMNLVIVDHLYNYSGPVLLYRRLGDEVISTDERELVKSNRGNKLVIKLLMYRFPKLITKNTFQLLQDYANVDKDQKANIASSKGVDDDYCETLISSYLENETTVVYPIMIGEDLTEDLKEQMIIYLVDKYMDDFDSTHCTPLPGSLFRLPWDPKNVDFN